MILFLRNKRFNVTLFLSDYQLRWWRLPIEERAYRKTRLGGGDYQLRTSALPPWLQVATTLRNLGSYSIFSMVNVDQYHVEYYFRIGKYFIFQQKGCII